ncbi:unnamed protein product [Parascedosporium putredinis]|uniref:Uncharacterized protein n=1 Tax=Parascedosporium putredinis TaxID=1442378 RepID=A0A9P1GVT0_9PEZI|nr:unnamed protein product [Parascedosporium putredinis]CAI7988013.1 unnamed protein product [Parascedosporium putredinis]
MITLEGPEDWYGWNQWIRSMVHYARLDEVILKGTAARPKMPQLPDIWVYLDNYLAAGKEIPESLERGKDYPFSEIFHLLTEEGVVAYRFAVDDIMLSLIAPFHIQAIVPRQTANSIMRSGAALALFFGFVPVLVSSLGLDADDVPITCAAICGPLVQLSFACDVDDDLVGDRQEELLERQCICGNTTFNVAATTADCAVCVGQNAIDRDDLEDVNEILIACGFV